MGRLYRDAGLSGQAGVAGPARSGTPRWFNACATIGDGRRPATAAVELRGVYRRFGRTMVLAGLDLEVDEGEL
jgi:hypothetical protein